MFLNNKQKWIVFVAVGLMMLSVSYWSHLKEKESMYILSGKDKDFPVELNIDQEIDNNQQEDSIIMIHVTGEVVVPGVYELKEGTRILDVVEAAGGFTQEADGEQVNLAMKIYDEDKIHIPAKGEVATPLPKESNSLTNTQGNRGKINVNKASEGELTQLTGIGPALAGRIIDYREANGPFKRIEDLKKVSGIGDIKFEQIKNNIIVQ